jgi:3D (Asp-Asp-Asp) domain-containing protein
LETCNFLQDSFARRRTKMALLHSTPWLLYEPLEESKMARPLLASALAAVSLHVVCAFACSPGEADCSGQPPPSLPYIDVAEVDTAVCEVPGHWKNNFNDTYHINQNLTGTIHFTNGCPDGTVVVTLNGVIGFHTTGTHGIQPFGAGQCVNWVEDMTWQDCNHALGTYTNASGNGGFLSWDRTGPWVDITKRDLNIPTSSRVQSSRVLTKAYLDLLVTTDTGGPVAGQSLTLKSDRAPGEDIFAQPAPTDIDGTTTATVETRDQATGSTITSAEPDVATRTAAKIDWLPAKYESDFLNTCYIASREADFASDPNMDSNLPGLPPGHSYHHNFVVDVRLQGSGLALDGSYLHYNRGPNNYNLDTCARTATGICAVDGVTLAVDPHVIPLNAAVNIINLGPRTAQDTGGRILDYHVDVFYGLRRADCLGQRNPQRTLELTSY